MPLVACPDCQSEISTAAAACPRCGCPQAQSAIIVVESRDAIGTRDSGSLVYYSPRTPELKVRTIAVLFGLALLGGGLYFALSWIPLHDAAQTTPMRLFANAAAREAQFLKPDQVRLATIAAWVCAALGVAQLLTGSYKRTGHLVYCDQCDRTVYAKKRKFGCECERCGGRVRK